MNFLNDSNQEATVLSSPRTCLSQEELQKQKFKADNVTWFTHNEFVWRSGASVVWFLFLLPIICILYLLVVTFSLVHPLTWMAGFISKMFSLWEMTVYIMTIGIIMVPVVLMNITICSVEVNYGQTRMSALVSFFTYKHLHHLLLCILSGCGATCWVSSFTYTEYGMFIQNCTSLCEGQSSSTCLNETSLFLMVFATILGISYATLFFQENRHHIKFPVAQQERIFRMKACLVPCFWQAVIVCLKSLQICYPLYFLFGFFARKTVREITGLDRDREATPRDSLYGLLDIRLFWFSLITGTFVTYLWTLANKLFIIFQTEVLRFPIQSTLIEQSEQGLPVVIKCQTVPLLKYLAFNDLCQLSQFSAKRRKQIFSLSIPGGRPLNWLWVSEECLCLLNHLKEKLVLANNALTKSSVVLPPSITTPKGMQGVQCSTNGTPSSPFLRHRSTSSGTQSSTDMTATGKNLADGNELKHTNKFSEKIRQFPLVRFLLEKREDAEMEEVFFDAQLQIWAAEGLSCLVAASFTEDVFGVVQKTLPFILSSLLELLQAVEVYLKNPQGPQHLFRVRRPSELRKTVNVLRNSLRCSIYRITKTFQRHLNDVELTANNREYLKTFLNFEE